MWNIVMDVMGNRSKGYIRGQTAAWLPIHDMMNQLIVLVVMLWAYGSDMIGCNNELATRHIPEIPLRNDTLAGPMHRRCDMVRQELTLASSAISMPFCYFQTTMHFNCLNPIFFVQRLVATRSCIVTTYPRLHPSGYQWQRMWGKTQRWDLVT